MTMKMITRNILFAKNDKINNDGTNNKLRYYIFGETLFGRRLEEVAGILKEKQCSVGQL